MIDAINRDQPFDQFTVEQLAGDLLPEATLEQKIATGFHRNSLKNDEAGADLELDRCKAAVDRTATTGAVWLGLTVGCAECHSHKYDPISQREFYQLTPFSATPRCDLHAASRGTGDLPGKSSGMTHTRLKGIAGIWRAASRPSARLGKA